eukprot:257142_1
MAFYCYFGLHFVQIKDWKEQQNTSNNYVMNVDAICATQMNVICDLLNDYCVTLLERCALSWIPLKQSIVMEHDDINTIKIGSINIDLSCKDVNEAIYSGQSHSTREYQCNRDRSNLRKSDA